MQNYVVLKKKNQKIIPVTRKEAVKGLTDDLSQINSRLESLEQSGGGGDENSVKYVSQQLSAAQKEQARSNIGAVGSGDLQNALSGKQDKLVSGNNIKTINGVPILGNGDITIGSGGTFTQVQADWNQDDETAVDFIKNKPTISDNYEYLSYLDSEKEDKSNKVTSISNNSTNDEYPSAKLLYDQLALKQDKIDANHKLPANLVEGLDISGKEDKSNKVTSISASSTDTQYPSAKCVYDIVGDIESLLAAL